LSLICVPTVLQLLFPWVRGRRSDCCCKGTTSGCNSSSALACRGFFVLVEAWILNLCTIYSWGFESIWKLVFLFVGPCDKDYRLGSNFWKFYLIRTGFILGEPVSLVKVFRPFRLEWIFFLAFRVWTQ
jgi:hypothetical protein